MASELFVSRIGGQNWAAVRQDGLTTELRVERVGDPGWVGRIVKARVTKVVPAIQAAFLDIGMQRDAFLFAADLLLPGESPPAATGSGPAAAVPIDSRLKAGRELLVQMVRDSGQGKGARATCMLSFPGRLLVLLPNSRIRAVSRRIVDPVERERLASALAQLEPPQAGFLVRTAARGAAGDALRREAAGLLRLWEQVRLRAEAARSPSVVHVGFDMPLRMLRDAPSRGFVSIVMDDADNLERAREYLEAVEGGASGLRRYEGAGPMFQAYGLDRDVERALASRIRLKSGADIVIQQTEALVSIDVNTARAVRGRGHQEAIVATNLEAAAEIARQLRLRDLGGIIVIDFIDMEREEDRQRVVEALTRALVGDPARTRVAGLSELGLLQLTRKRTRPNLVTAVTRHCPRCAGAGRVKSLHTIAGEAIAELSRLRAGSAAQAWKIRAHPDVTRLIEAILGTATGVRLEADPGVESDRFEVVAQPSG